MIYVIIGIIVVIVAGIIIKKLISSKKEEYDCKLTGKIKKLEENEIDRTENVD